MSIISRWQIQVLGYLATMFGGVFAQSAMSVTAGLLTSQDMESCFTGIM